MSQCYRELRWLLPICLAVVLLGGAIRAWPRATPVLPPVAPLVAQASGALTLLTPASERGAAAEVTDIVRVTVGPSVLAIERALAAANVQVQTYCTGRHMSVTLCFESGVDPNDAAAVTLAEVFRRQALLLGGVGPALDARLVAVGLASQLLTAQMHGLLEDLAMSSAQLVDLLQDYAGPLLAEGQVPVTASDSGTTMRGLAYGARVRVLIAELQRAEQWLESIDHETGARVRLPGFGDGNSLRILLAAP
jgi:hypothetical protein